MWTVCLSWWIQAWQECKSNSNRSIKNYRPTKIWDPYYSSLHGKKVNESCGSRVFCHMTKICEPQQLYICICTLFFFLVYLQFSSY